jgi:hypothetical protein
MATGLTERTPSMATMQGNLNVNAKLLGAKEMAAVLRQLPPAARKAILNAFEKEAWKIIKTAQQRYVPVDTGQLAFSGMVYTHPGMYPSVEFGFGGAAKAYAVVQHENEWFQHPGGGGPYYLSIPTEAAMPRVVKQTGIEIRTEFSKFDTRRFQ